MLKKVLACLLAAVLVLLPGCGNFKATEGITVIGDTESRDPLRICVDLEYSAESFDAWTEAAWNDFLFRLHETAGIEDVVVEIIPPPFDAKGMPDPTLRKTVLQRIRTEIMAGEGPDVFLMRYTPAWKFAAGGVMIENDYEGTDFLFRYPEKAMETGLFLPLDEYIENNAELGEWDEIVQPVLDAGRNEEGLQLVPLDYTFPLLCYPKSEWEHVPDKKYTWNDMLTNPELLPYSLDLANCGATERFFSLDSAGNVDSSSEEWLSNTNYICHILGDLADYKNETPSFTEEELLGLVNEIMALEKADGYTSVDTAKEELAGSKISERVFNKPTTFLPLYSMDGGITAHIESFAAVNRNTDRPEDAFKVIDLLMNRYFQRWGDLYNEIILMYGNLPMNGELFQKTDPLCRDNFYMTDENFEAFCTVREQITGANFNSEITVMLEEMLSKCFEKEKYINTEFAEYYPQTIEEIVHETYEHLEKRLKE